MPRVDSSRLRPWADDWALPARRSTVGVALARYWRCPWRHIAMGIRRGSSWTHGCCPAWKKYFRPSPCEIHGQSPAGSLAKTLFSIVSVRSMSSAPETSPVFVAQRLFSGSKAPAKVPTPGPHPLPPARVFRRRLPLRVTAQSWFRLHAFSYGAMYWGRDPPRPEPFRFDAPAHEFGILYAGEDPRC